MFIDFLNYTFKLQAYRSFLSLAAGFWRFTHASCRPIRVGLLAPILMLYIGYIDDSMRNDLESSLEFVGKP